MFTNEDDDIITGKPKRWRRFARHFPFLVYMFCCLLFALLIGAIYAAAYRLSYWLLWRGNQSTAFICGFSCAGVAFLWGCWIIFQRNGGGGGVDFREFSTASASHPKKRPAKHQPDTLSEDDIDKALRRINRRRKK